MTTHVQAVAHLRRRIGTALVLRQVVTYVTAWAFLWGVSVIVLRVALAVPVPDLLWGFAAIPIALAVGLVLGRRQMPSAASVCALLDRASGAGGLLLAAEERELDGWAQALPPVADVHVRWHGARAWTLLAAAALFLAIALLFPEKLVSLRSGHGLEIGSDVARLSQQLDALKETGVLDPTRVESLEEKLKNLKDTASGENPAKTLEALDHLQDLANRAAQEAAEAGAQKTEKLAEAEALAEGLGKAAGEIDGKLRADALGELARLAEKAAAENKSLDSSLDPEALKNFKSGTLNPEQLKELAQALRDARKDILRTMQKLHKARLIDAETLAKCENCGKCNSDAMCNCLKKGNQSVRAMCKECQRPGRGGLNEGPGAAELTWGDPSSDEGAKFKEEALPPAALGALKDSRLVGVGGKAPPMPAKGGAPSPSGALANAAAGAGSAHTEVVLPRHRAAVERYFERAANVDK
jgi:hypothetical protein